MLGFGAVRNSFFRRQAGSGLRCRLVLAGLVCSTVALAGEVDIAQPLGGGPLPPDEQDVLLELVRDGGELTLFTSDPAFQIHRLVVRWADAWSRQDAVAYLSFYAQDFVPSGRYDGFTLEEWRLSRRDRIRAPEWVRVEPSNFQVILSSDDRAQVRFVQDYSSANFSDWM